MTLRLLQVCNVGTIVGGTTACAWTVTRSLPGCEHVVAFLGPVSAEARRAFSACRLLGWDGIDAARVREVRPDLVLLHNTPRRRLAERLPVPSIQYRHSRTAPAPADLTLYCSRWLAEQCRGDRGAVCVQGVPKPLRPEPPPESRALRAEPVVGRLCTPQLRKWPVESPDFYRRLAEASPAVRWEFVGCPGELAPRLRDAVRGRAVFHPPSWTARRRLWTWDAMLYHNPHLPESFGRTAAESMRAGCVPLLDDRGGFREQVAEGCGYLCDGPDDFIAALKALQGPSRRRAMSRACEAYADARFSLAAFRRELLRRFRAAADRHGTPDC